MEVLLVASPADVPGLQLYAVRIRQEPTPPTNLSNTNLLKYLVNSGRYNLHLGDGLSPNQLALKNQEHKNIIIVKGQACYEIVSYIIYVPESINVVNTIEALTSN